MKSAGGSVFNFHTQWKSYVSNCKHCCGNWKDESSSRPSWIMWPKTYSIRKKGTIFHPAIVFSFSFLSFACRYYRNVTQLFPEKCSKCVFCWILLLSVINIIAQKLSSDWVDCSTHSHIRTKLSQLSTQTHLTNLTFPYARIEKEATNGCMGLVIQLRHVLRTFSHSFDIISIAQEDKSFGLRSEWKPLFQINQRNIFTYAFSTSELCATLSLSTKFQRRQRVEKRCDEQHK